MKYFALLICVAVAPHLSAQTKRPLDHADFALWNAIENVRVSNDGAWISYMIVPGEGDHTLVLYEVATGMSQHFGRGQRAQFTDDSRHFIFSITPHQDSIRALKRRKVDQEKHPSDTLVICHLDDLRIEKIPDLEGFEVPDRWSGFVAYQIRPALKPEEEKDTVALESTERPEPPKTDKKTKKPSKKTGYPLIVHTLGSGAEDTLRFVTHFSLSKYGPVVAAITTGDDKDLAAGVYTVPAGDDNRLWHPVKTQKGTYKHLVWDEHGSRLSFAGDTDTSQAQIRQFSLYHWLPGMDSAAVLIDAEGAFLPKEWHISEYYRPRFSASGGRLHFGIAPWPLVQDTTLLDDEIVNVEVWHYLDDRLYTQQNVRAKQERERSYHCILDLESGEILQVAAPHMPETRMDRDGNSPYLIVFDESPYLREMSWEGWPRRDVWTCDASTGTYHRIVHGTDGMPQLSPEFRYLSWYARADSAWYVSPVTGIPVNVSKALPAPVFNERNDVPAHPSSYGMAGWLADDAALLIYDRFDLWKVDPTGVELPVNLTGGRDAGTRYRYIRLDPDERSINPEAPILLYAFDENTRASGYALLDLQTNEVRRLQLADLAFENSPVKARDADLMVFTLESYKVFPDLYYTSDWFENQTRVSDVNPQQAGYHWGTIELYRWTAYDGQELEGMLVKPDNFDPSQQYPMIVNFYERSSDGLHNHRRPFPHRSTINYPFYASRGYIIFNPDVVYHTGYPGERAYNAVVSGTEALLAEGFIDPSRVGIQGHSWGGYQIAHILTKTDIYACAESGAPVVNMVSAYGGIRWETGLSRMFQYERTQSRLGASLWEAPELYLENSPVFNLDKITTPVLILHNDADGHVPWHQGIEFFVSMRRLGKPAWMLNYPGEPHWPVKLQNRKDFNVRMQQFFDHFLMGAPMPQWMRDGVPATAKGILQGLELTGSLE